MTSEPRDTLFHLIVDVLADLWPAGREDDVNDLDRIAEAVIEALVLANAKAGEISQALDSIRLMS